MTRKASRIAAVALLLAVGLPGAALLLLPDLRAAVGAGIHLLTTAEVEAAVAGLIDYLRSFGIWAPVVSAALMVLQSVAAPIPDLCKWPAFLPVLGRGAVLVRNGFGWPCAAGRSGVVGRSAAPANRVGRAWVCRLEHPLAEREIR
ncbi:hypothetical protein [Tabrizicola sp. TH137]|uniref:hypothetical protein n=1 Tax=Tabrizicola sp. TH137 TaxID=2067452 RepID=UPI001C200D30|nr:hypothetical protein [Tabrizicola sp. TH137]